MTGSDSESDAATVRVLLFSVLRERVGAQVLRLPLPDPPTGSALLDQIETEHPCLASFRPVMRLAVNASYVKPEALLRAGDEVALITPVSGG